MDQNFTVLKQAVEAFALPFENGSRRSVVFSQNQPSDTGLIWGKLSPANVVVEMLWHNGSAWVQFMDRTHWFAADASTVANTVALTIPGITGLVTGQKVAWSNLLAVTGAANVRVNGGSPIPLVQCDGAALTPGQIPSGWLVDALYDGTSLKVLNPKPALGDKATKWTSALLPLATDTYTHPLGRAPDQWSLKLVCETTNNEYNVGEVIDGNKVYISDASDQDDFELLHAVWTPTTFRLNAAIPGVGDNVILRIRNQTGADGDRVIINRDNWRVQVVAVVWA